MGYASAAFVAFVVRSCVVVVVAVGVTFGFAESSLVRLLFVVIVVAVVASAISTVVGC